MIMIKIVIRIVTALIMSTRFWGRKSLTLPPQDICGTIVMIDIAAKKLEGEAKAFSKGVQSTQDQGQYLTDQIIFKRTYGTNTYIYIYMCFCIRTMLWLH